MKALFRFAGAGDARGARGWRRGGDGRERDEEGGKKEKERGERKDLYVRKRGRRERRRIYI